MFLLAYICKYFINVSLQHSLVQLLQEYDRIEIVNSILDPIYNLVYASKFSVS